MVTVQSFLKVDANLVSVEEFAGPIIDEDYIEGAIELSVDRRPILTREMVDYVDQLWAYLIRGLGEVVAGREFSTSYPDMPLEIMFRPQRDRVTIIVDPRERNMEASLSIEELLAGMVPAGTLFFERLRPYAPGNQSMYDKHISRWPH